MSCLLACLLPSRRSSSPGQQLAGGGTGGSECQDNSRAAAGANKTPGAVANGTPLSAGGPHAVGDAVALALAVQSGRQGPPNKTEASMQDCVEAVGAHRQHLGDDFKREGAQWVAVTRQQLFSWSFNVFDFASQTRGNPLITMTTALLEHYGLLDGWKLNRKTIENFLLTVEAEYRPNAYHNSIHAADVTQTSAIIMESVAKHVGPIAKMDIFVIVVASAVHDLGHLGVNNDFLINSRHPRATTYNDRSVNESYHISRAFEVARTTRGCDIFEQFTFDEQKKCRKLMVDMVMATDMAIHFDLLKRFNAAIDAQPDIAGWQDQGLVFQMLLHLADIANPSRPFHLARGWAERVITEFCEQGDKEASCGLPLSPFCVRATMDMPRAQLNFIEVFLRPTLTAYQRAAPQFVSMALECLDTTVREWGSLRDSGFKM